jgi:colanic acid/amylovoran biosynthesis glycosyltransferase
VNNALESVPAGSGQVGEFYDDMAGGLLRAYVYGSPRLDLALHFVLNHLPAGARRILDVGCGVGQSTIAIKRACPDADVLGIDLSERLIGVARALWDRDGVSFEVADLAEIGGVEAFDVVVLIDAYEHMPIRARPAVHAALARLIAPAGRLLLTTPSLSYQSFLRANHPERLQPIDEDVTRPHLDSLAADIGGCVVHNAEVTVWRPGDYTHTAIVRGTAARDAPAASPRLGDSDARQRAEFVASRLGVRVTPEGILLRCGGGMKVCVAQPNCDVYSERLIRAHLERLPNVVSLCDGWFPRRRWNGERLLPPVHRAARRAALGLGGWGGTPSRAIETDGLARYLRRERVDVVLAEYGPTGAAIVDACVRAQVPLIAHFHGFDAHHGPTLREYRDRYHRLFDVAAGVVAVSRKMEQQLLRLGARRETLHFNAAGVDTARFSGADPAASPPTFVSVGRFVEKKAPHLTLRAFEKVRSVCPAARLIMFGDGSLLESARQTAATAQLAGAVEFRGARRHVEIAGALRTARAFVLHSVETAAGDSEGLPVALLEAAASGLPVVSTHHAGIPDAVIDGETGFLVREHDVDSMAARMIELALHPELAGLLGARGRQHIQANFSIERSIAGLLDILTAAIPPPRPAQVHRR